MKNYIACLSFVVLASCAGLNEAMEYSGTPPVSYNINGDVWRIFDQPEKNRLMITPSIGDSAASGAADGFTFGLAVNPYTLQATFEPAVEAYLSERGCKVTSAKLIIRPQFEFEYAC
jgi:hypothetical protein